MSGPADEEAQASILPRRRVLRGALALAVAALVPVSLVGCNKKGEPSTGAAPSDSIATPAANKKMLQADVAYQLQPNAAQRCENCQNFQAETSSCMVVAGEISPQGWCRLWTQK